MALGLLLFLFLPISFAYVDYTDLGCKQIGDSCLPYNPTDEYYVNRFDMAHFFPQVLRNAIGSLSIPTQFKIIALKPNIKHYYITGEASTAEDVLGLIQAHILPNETELLRAGLLFDTLNMPKKVIDKISKFTNILLRAYYVNDNWNSASVLMFVMIELYKGPLNFSTQDKEDLMSQFANLAKFIKEFRAENYGIHQ
ncbi:hypothetical protein QR680_013735 [Steinernema hermaphroditum]|uniref:Uncharacterized protein n=1 Tax=Steinernema hermaphroditum TaxID=289476 RepID=A0AA39I937_9BILA|nr:hypothetical protein QR680_013735 [Steinernema hermaphroditum]